ncbi:uncharacterized protein LOC119367147 [Triticum dicoccoides]|uniref:uncharacterized protein LOC119367147 n=1 Tax=Triticum dicoccoides TaxID=85692 RepID=UPI00188FC607|nr:uncharacterized protein LOC119367147 [Triticum dicoccoides]
MDQFHDGHHVRLRNLVQRTYLHAADDGVGVTLHERRASMNAAWAVHIYHGGDGDGDGDGHRLLLHSAAYGRYLAAGARPARLGHRGLRAELSDYDLPEVEAIMWRAVGSGFDFEDDVVLLRHVGGRYLRANGKYLPWNSSGVSVDDDDDASPMMYWVVEPIPFREAGMPAIPGPLPTRPRCLSAIFGSPGRRILFVGALENGFYPEEVDGWRLFLFKERSVFRLRDDLAFRVAAGVDDPNIVMCVRAGRYGRLTPLVVDLPHGSYGETLEIVVFLAGTPAYDALRYPDADA